MKHASLFSGIGGFDLAAEWMGWDNVFHCEWMEFPRRVLEFYWPEADSYTDICKTDFKKYEGTIEIITGGFPCQPFSLAGKRKGTEDERFLWKEMLRAVQEVKPKYVIAENVLGLTSIDGGLVLETVWSDLENEGYEVQSFIIPAASKNAPHRRDRIWIVAHHSSIRFNSGGTEQPLSRNGSNGIEGITSNTDHARTDFRMRSDRNGSKKNFREQFPQSKLGPGGGDGAIANATNDRNRKQQRTNRRRQNRLFVNDGKVGNVTNPGKIRLSESLEVRKLGWVGSRFGSERNTWDTFPSQPPVCGGNDGLPSELDGITFSKWRQESIKGYGNAIVPQVAFEIFKVIQEMENNSI
jgi:DNA (cytosine-5)-methyltransferase 1